MKKNIFVIVLLLPLVFALTACGGDDVEHTDPSLLIGTWASSNATFTIEDDYSFVCRLINIDVTGQSPEPVPAKVSGKLESTGEGGKGADQYVLRDLATVDEPGLETGNEEVDARLPLLQGIKCSLKFNEDQSAFVFSSSVLLAQAFFGATYTKQQ